MQKKKPEENCFLRRKTNDSNQDHQLSWWYALRLKGDSTGGPTRALNGLPVAFPSRAAAKAAHVFVFVVMNQFEV